MNRDRTPVLSGLLALVTVVASLQIMFPAGHASATATPPLAWGSDDHGQLGPNGVQPFTATPVEIPGVGDVTQVSAGLSHTVALRSDGTVWAWGRNRENELGDGQSVYVAPNAAGNAVPPPDRPAPGPVYQRDEVLSPAANVAPTVGPPQPLTNVKAIAAGHYHTLALKNDGTVWAWGENYCGELGNGKRVTGGLGDTMTPQDAIPPAAVKVPGLSNIVAIAAGRGHSLALDSSGTVWAWGDDRWGQLGNGSSKIPRFSCPMPDGGPAGYAQYVPTAVPLNAPVVAIAAGSDHSLAVTEDPTSKAHTVWSWGNNCSGQLGSSPAAETTAFRSVATPVSGLPSDPVTAVAAGGPAFGGFSLALTAGGQVWAWGLADVLGDGSGHGATVSPCIADPTFNAPQVGDGQSDDVVGLRDQQGQLTPAPVVASSTGQALTDVASLAAGVFHTLAVRRDHTLVGWGHNDLGQLGPGAGPSAPAAVSVLDRPVVGVAAGSHSVALPADSATTTTTAPTTTTTTLPVSTTSPVTSVPVSTTLPVTSVPVSTTLPVTTLPVSTTLPVTTLPGSTTIPIPIGTTSSTSSTSTSTTQPGGTTTTTQPHVTTTTIGPTTTTTTAVRPPTRDRVIVWATSPTQSLGGGPDGRHAAAMAYDAGRQQTILFGGIREDDFGIKSYGDTWAWNGTIWSELTSQGPQARDGHAMAYDAARKQIVLFGGLDRDQHALGDTWTWDGSKWTQVVTTAGPSPRAFATVTYDSDTSQVVLFGGEDADGRALADTWAWDGTSWTELHPASAPPARSRSAMAYDPDTHSALLYGGWNGVGPLDDTWSWDGAAWRQENTGPYPEPRQGHAMAYHPATHQVVLVGGSQKIGAAPQCCDLTWTWDGDHWGTATVEAPPLGSQTLVGTRFSASMAEDALGRLALFGGHEMGLGTIDLNDTELFMVPVAATTPSPLPQPAPVCATRESAMPSQAVTTTTTMPGSTTTVPTASTTTTTTQPAGTSVAGSTWMQQSPASSPSPREGAAVAYDPVKKQTILFGGFNVAGNPCVDGDTWMWDGSTWTQLQPAASPLARYGHTMAYDAEHHQVVLFGGSDGAADLADTWVWDGTTWARKQSPAAPSPRARQAMAYDADRRQVVLFGGDHQRTALGDTWVWDGSEWAERHPATSPPRRGDAAMAYDAARHDAVLAGGWDAAWSDAYGNSTYDDTWLWDGSNWQKTAVFGLYVHSAAIAFDPTSQKVVLRWGATTGAPGTGPDDRRYVTDAWDGNTWTAVDPGNGAGVFPPSSGTEPPARTFAAMAEDAGGGLVFFGGYGPPAGADVGAQLGDARPKTGGVPVVDPPNAEQGDTWTYRAPAGQVTVPVTPPGRPGAEGYRISLQVAPSEIAADGTSTATATATVTNNGLAQSGRKVFFTTDGDVTFSAVVDHGDGTYTSTITASRTAGVETITATNEESVYGTASAPLVERGVTVTLNPSSIHPDKVSTSRATATLYGSVPDQDVQFRTDGDVTFSPVEHPSDHVWAVTITASGTPGKETITATASPSGLSGSAILTEGSNGWFDASPPSTAPSPPARDESAMAFDSTRNETVLFGGYNGDSSHPFGDTWVWNGSTWAERHPPASPPARFGHAMAYDAARHQVVLFGGYGASGYLGDTWTWDGTTWTEHAGASPSPRYRTAMAYDEKTANVVLFGGWTGQDCNADTGICPALGDTWTWDGSAWTNRTSQAPPPPPPDTGPKDFSNPQAISVPLPSPPPGCPGVKCPPDQASPYPSDIPVSGLSGKVADVTVTLHDLSWTQSGPADADIMLVAPGGKAVMVMSDACGTSTSPNPIPPDHPVTFTFADSAPATLSSDGPCSSGSYKPTNVSTPECTPWHSPDYFPAPAPPGTTSTSFRDFTGIDPNGTWSLYVVDDCPNDPNPTGEAGRIDGGWTLSINTTGAAVTGVAAPLSPPPRAWAAMGYHPPSGKVVLYGGTQAYLTVDARSGALYSSGAPFNPLEDTWTWDGSTWTQEGSGTNPGLRHSASMAFNPGSGQLMLFGGSDGHGGDVPDSQYSRPQSRQDTTRADTWTWDGTVWAPQASPATPPSRHSAAMATGPSGTVVMFSGLHAVPGNLASDLSYLGDTWVYESTVTVRLEPAVLPADGSSTSTVTATVVDAAGYGISGLAVTFATSGDARFSPTLDHGDGTYSATVTASRTDGIQTITATTPYGSAATTLNEVLAAPCSAATTAASGTWETVAPMPEPRWRMGVAVGRDGRIYVFGGTPGYVVRQGSPVEVFNGDEYLSTIESYDACTNTWRSLPGMPGGGRTWLTAAAAPDGRIYVVGGSSYGSQLVGGTKQVEVYTPGIGTTPGRWATLPPMPEERDTSASAVGDDGRLYVMGGLTAGAPPPCGSVRTADVYTPGPGGAPGRWDVLPELSVPRVALSGATAPGGRILAIGGADANCEGFSTVEGLDPGAAAWQPVTPMATPRVYAAAAVSDNSVYVTGGSGVGAIYAYGVNPATNTVEAYDTCVQAWAPVPPMPRTRAYHAAARGGDGRIYVIGGMTDRGGTTPTAQASLTPTALVDAYTPDASVNACARLSINDVTVTEPASGSTLARFTVSLDRPATSPVKVGYATHDGTAKAGSDYTATSGTLEFGAAEVSKTLDVPVLADSVVEGPETFTVTLTLLTPGSATVARGTGTATITDTTPSLPSVGVSDPPGPVTEPASGTAPATFTVSLSGPAPGPVTVHYATADGTATAPADYAATSGQLPFAPGETTKVVTVAVNHDDAPDGTETFSLVLSDPQGATLGRDRATGTIVDAGGPPPPPSVGVAGPPGAVTEPPAGAPPATATFTLSLSAPASGPVQVHYATADGTARAGVDYTPTSGLASFDAGATTRSVDVPVLHDDAPDGAETFSVVLSDPQGASLDPGHDRATATIVDAGGGAPTLSIADAPVVVEPAPGDPPALATFGVSLSAPSAQVVQVGYATSDGTATAGVDYVGVRGATVTFGPGVTTRTIEVGVLADPAPDGREAFSITLSDPINATIAQGTATAIIDDHPPVSHRYECTATTDLTTTGATLHAHSDDPAVSGATFTLSKGTTVVGTYPAPSRAVAVSGLDPATTYTYTASFGPHPQTNPPCSFTTAAAAGGGSSTSSSSTSSSSSSTSSSSTSSTAPTTTITGPTTTTRPSTTTTSPTTSSTTTSPSTTSMSTSSTVPTLTTTSSTPPTTRSTTTPTSSSPTSTTLGPRATPAAYACGPTLAATPTSAEVAGSTTDPSVSSATFTLTDASGHVVQTVGPRSGASPFSVTFRGLTPDADYAYAVRFDPDAHPSAGSCLLHTPALPGSPPPPADHTQPPPGGVPGGGNTPAAVVAASPVPVGAPSAAPLGSASPAGAASGATSPSGAASAAASGAASAASSGAASAAGSGVTAGATSGAGGTSAAGSGAASGSGGSATAPTPGATPAPQPGSPGAGGQDRLLAGGPAPAGLSPQAAAGGETGLFADAERDPQAQVQAEIVQAEPPEPYAASARRRDPIPAPALAWAAAVLALGLGAGVARRPQPRVAPAPARARSRRRRPRRPNRKVTP